MLIESDEQLKSELIKEMQEAINEVAGTIAMELTNSIQSNIYNSPPSAYYDRTYEFLQSVIKPEVTVSGNEVSALIGMDYKKITARLTPPNKFNAHMSVDGNPSWGSASVAEGLLTWWDTGTNNAVLPSVPATNYWYDVFGDHANDNPNYKKLDDLIDKVVTKHLKKFGITY